MSACSSSSQVEYTFTSEPIIPSTKTLAVTPSVTSTQTSIPTATVTPTVTSTLYDLVFSAFHDYNGNETQEQDEPYLSNIVVLVIKPNQKMRALFGSVPLEEWDYYCVTDGTGSCVISTIPEGKYLVVTDTSNSSVPSLEYLFWENHVTDGIDLYINTNSSINVGLAQGFYVIGLDDAADYYSNPEHGYDPVGYDGTPHNAYDFMINGTELVYIYANVSGIVQGPPDEPSENPYGDCNIVKIFPDDEILMKNNIQIQYGHLTSVEVQPGTHVEKGDIIGSIDPSLYSPNLIRIDENGNYIYNQQTGTANYGCTTAPHFEFSLLGNGGEGIEANWGWLDPKLFSPKTGELIPGF